MTFAGRCRIGLALEGVGKDGIIVNDVSPGPILTPKLERVFRKTARSRGWADEVYGK
jgi:NAD(P)-dependent dehydrogenase (short-subunit alcohol dehydrogenase family)